MRSVILIIGILIITGCSGDIKSEKTVWFDIPGLSNQLVKSMSVAAPTVEKEFEFNGVSESLRIEVSDSSFWKQELAKLTETNLNSPSVRDYIALKSAARDHRSNLMVDQYIIESESKSSLNEVLIYYLDVPSEIRQISVSLKESNLITDSETVINIWLNRYQDILLIDSLSLSSHEKTILQAPRDYTNKLTVVW